MAVRPRPWRRRAALLQVWREDGLSQLLLRGLLASQAICWFGSGECESRGWVIACASLRNGFKDGDGCAFSAELPFVSSGSQW